MSDLAELLAAEAVRRQPEHQPAFADLVRARAGRDRRRRTITGVAAVVVLAGLGGAALLAPGQQPDPSRPHDIVRAPRPATVDGAVPVTGSLRLVGGPIDTPSRGAAGMVSFQAADGTVTTATAAADGRFSLSVPAGRYVATGNLVAQSGPPSCFAIGPVVVPAGGLGGVEVTCQLR